MFENGPSVTTDDVELAFSVADAGHGEQDARHGQAVSVSKPSKAMTLGDKGLVIGDTSEALRAARGLWAAGLVPESFKSEQQVMTAIMYLREIGLNPMTGIGHVYLVNNRCALFGDAAIAVCYQGGQVADVLESVTGEGREMRAVCEVVRFNSRGERMSPRRGEFSMDMAETAGLASRGLYRKFPHRLLMWRARHYAFRDAFPDMMLGLDWAVSTPDGAISVIGGPNDGSEIQRGAFNARDVEPESLDAETARKIAERQAQEQGQQ